HLPQPDDSDQPCDELKRDLDGGNQLLCQQDYPYADKNDCKPAAVVDVLAEKDLCRGSVAYICERGGGGGSERELDDGESEEHGEEVERHAERSDAKERAGE